MATQNTTIKTQLCVFDSNITAINPDASPSNLEDGIDMRLTQVESALSDLIMASNGEILESFSTNTLWLLQCRVSEAKKLFEHLTDKVRYKAISKEESEAISN
ncbi:hypothetical protein KC887_05500 [Candidatus Kaiserbacteria bacterium]|nr:hypothetical protein [Candidatus Kaiserbacteria bacterium]